MDLIKATPNKERVKSILDMIALVEDRINSLDKIKFTPLILSDYYEIIKELITAVLLCDGFKTLSHKDLIDYLKLNYPLINSQEVELIDKLRILRNRISYEGFKIPSDYLANNELIYKDIIKKLKTLVNSKIKNKEGGYYAGKNKC